MGVTLDRRGRHAKLCGKTFGGFKGITLIPFFVWPMRLFLLRQIPLAPQVALVRLAVLFSVEPEAFQFLGHAGRVAWESHGLGVRHQLGAFRVRMRESIDPFLLATSRV